MIKKEMEKNEKIKKYRKKKQIRNKPHKVINSHQNF